MKRLPILRLFITSMILFCVAGALRFARSAAAAAPSASPQPVAADEGALFTAFVPVLRHPRCMNCHSQGDYPRQGDDGHPHTMNIRRGPVGFGVTAVKCSTCHQDHNLDGAHLPPGAPGWRLPPPSMPMIWQGLTDAQICESIKDPKQNRGRNLDQLVEHLTADKLVMWGWNPGEGRTPVPIPHDEFSAMVKQWQTAGAPCPAK
ncbi:MAG TPA: hypothetical protein VFF64_12830 [Candidatus Eremiobacteraceae bacterium]|nr:hypothetical protein [Candidatus Eremiobacteraceae bacterium]